MQSGFSRQNSFKKEVLVIENNHLTGSTKIKVANLIENFWACKWFEEPNSTNVVVTGCIREGIEESKYEIFVDRYQPSKRGTYESLVVRNEGIEREYLFVSDRVETTDVLVVEVSNRGGIMSIGS